MFITLSQYIMPVPLETSTSPCPWTLWIDISRILKVDEPQSRYVYRLVEGGGSFFLHCSNICFSGHVDISQEIMNRREHQKLWAQNNKTLSNQLIVAIGRRFFKCIVDWSFHWLGLPNVSFQVWLHHLSFRAIDDIRKTESLCLFWRGWIPHLPTHTAQRWERPFLEVPARLPRLATEERCQTQRKTLACGMWCFCSRQRLIEFMYLQPS